MRSSARGTPDPGSGFVIQCLPTWAVGETPSRSHIEGQQHPEALMTDPASSSWLQDLSSALASVVEAFGPGIVAVHSQRSRSSGFIWRSGLIVTADEASAEEGEIAVSLAGGETVPARLVGRDPTTDIALLRSDRTDRPPAPLHTS